MGYHEQRHKQHGHVTWTCPLVIIVYDLFKLITIVLILQHTSVGINSAIFPDATVAENARKERVNAQLIAVADG
jgi:hypothetical protein